MLLPPAAARAEDIWLLQRRFDCWRASFKVRTYHSLIEMIADNGFMWLILSASGFLFIGKIVQAGTQILDSRVG